MKNNCDGNSVRNESSRWQNLAIITIIFRHGRNTMAQKKNHGSCENIVLVHGGLVDGLVGRMSYKIRELLATRFHRQNRTISLADEGVYARAWRSPCRTARLILVGHSYG